MEMIELTVVNQNESIVEYKEVQIRSTRTRAKTQYNRRHVQSIRKKMDGINIE